MYPERHKDWIDTRLLYYLSLVTCCPYVASACIPHPLSHPLSPVPHSITQPTSHFCITGLHPTPCSHPPLPCLPHQPAPSLTSHSTPCSTLPHANSCPLLNALCLLPGLLCPSPTALRKWASATLGERCLLQRRLLSDEGDKDRVAERSIPDLS